MNGTRWIASAWLCAATFAAGTTEARAQAKSYEVIRVDAGLSGGYASGVGAGGFGGLVEPKFLVHDNLAVGFRLEGMVTFGAGVSRGGDDVSLSSGSVGVSMVKAEYLAGTAVVRPVVGLGLGVYSIGGSEVTPGMGVSQRLGRYVGIAPQVGIELGRARLAVTYHSIVGADVVVEQTVGDPSTQEDFSQSFYSFELSFHFGGSRKRARAAPLSRAPPL